MWYASTKSPDLTLKKLSNETKNAIHKKKRNSWQLVKSYILFKSQYAQKSNTLGHFTRWVILMLLSWYPTILIQVTGPLLLTWIGSTLIPAWMSNHRASKAWDEIIYTFQNFNECTFDVWEWISHFIPHLVMCTYLSMLGLNSIHVKRGRNLHLPMDEHLSLMFFK